MFEGDNDPAEDQEIKRIFASAMKDYLGDTFENYYLLAGGSLTDFYSDWRQRADDIPIKFKQRVKAIMIHNQQWDGWQSSKQFGFPEPDANGEIKSDIDAVRPRKLRHLHLNNLQSLIDIVREWRDRCPDARRVNGHWKRLNRKGRLTISDPRTYIVFSLTTDCLKATVQPKGLGEWAIHGDAKAEALEELLNLYESADEFDEVFYLDMKQPEHPRLRLKSQQGAAGFYCYRR